MTFPKNQNWLKRTDRRLFCHVFTFLIYATVFHMPFAVCSLEAVSQLLLVLRPDPSTFHVHPVHGHAQAFHHRLLPKCIRIPHQTSTFHLALHGCQNWKLCSLSLTFSSEIVFVINLCSASCSWRPTIAFFKGSIFPASISGCSFVVRYFLIGWIFLCLHNGSNICIEIHNQRD